MTSSEDVSFQSLVARSLESALAGFACDPKSAEARDAVVAALTSLVESEARRIISQNLKLEVGPETVSITVGTPVAHLLRDVMGRADQYGGDLEIEVPVWKTRAEAQPMTRQYIDPRTNRPTRGRVML
jgi:hypothetical protein